MKELGKWQIVSMIAQGLAMISGAVQTFVIIRILSVGEWGIVQLATSIGGALGIYQHLGLVSASTREISSAEKKEDIFKIFITSTAVRYCVTLPLAIGLFFYSKSLAVNIYHNESLIIPLKMYALSLVFQGVQGILNSVISGMQRFKTLFVYQIVISYVSILLYIPLVHFFRINGYFYAFLLFNIISSIVLSVLAFKPLKGKLILPSKKDFMRLFKEIFSISIAIYVVKILYTNWEKLGSNALGLFNSPEVVAIYAFAMLYAKKIMSISDSVTTVNIPVFSERYAKNFNEFKETFVKNFNKLFSLIVFIGSFASYFAPDVIRLLVGGNKYNESFSLIAPMVFAFIIYSFVNIISSSVLIPAKMAKSMVGSYVFLIVGSVLSFFGLYKFIDLLSAVSWAMTFGSIICLGFMLYWIKKKMNFSFFNIDHVVILLQGFFIAWLCKVDVFWFKIAAFVPFASLLLWSLFVSKFFTKEDVMSMFRKFKGLVPKKLTSRAE
ncbi:oligosaccharide flippase family protein [candidate division WWE3 bacterium]|uniref:Oligosaccharide flippase family protein n=1 Tax=candidate division WWE3 bacterium TaxID=2053526 RepID=A0A7X9HSL7_UNCKA|nr:oligosaccharide flippase family protein [candidate division WWE3 bacterium]